MSEPIRWFDCDRCGRDVERVQYVSSGEAWCSDCWHGYNVGADGTGSCYSCGGDRCLKDREMTSCDRCGRDVTRAYRVHGERGMWCTNCLQIPGQEPEQVRISWLQRLMPMAPYLLALVFWALWLLIMAGRR